MEDVFKSRKGKHLCLSLFPNHGSQRKNLAPFLFADISNQWQDIPSPHHIGPISVFSVPAIFTVRD